MFQVHELLPFRMGNPVNRRTDERPPPRLDGLLEQRHLGLSRRPIRLQRIARDASADNIFPSGLATLVARNDVIQIEVLLWVILPEALTAILTGEAVPLKNRMTGKLDFVSRQPVI